MRDRTSPAEIPILENPYWFATPAGWNPKQDCAACGRLWREQSVLPAALAARQNRNALPSRTLSADCPAAQCPVGLDLGSALDRGLRHLPRQSLLVACELISRRGRCQPGQGARCTEWGSRRATALR